MKTKISFLILLFSWLVMATPPLDDAGAKLSGVVVNDQSLPIDGAVIEVFNEEGDLIDGALSNAQGIFEIKKLDKGTYVLKVTAFGFEDHEETINMDKSNMDLGEIILFPGLEIDEVVLRAETSKITQEIDKRVIDVGKDLVSAGATAAEVLNNIPSLSVDGQSGELSLRGNANVRVFVDGKPSTIPADQLLKQLPSNSIAKVEIITNPSAKYDPEGNSGIINIITNKKTNRGYNVTTDLGFTRARKEKYNGGINANFNTGKLNLFTNYNTYFGQGLFLGELQNNTLNLAQDFDLANDYASHLIKFGFDWFISDKSALTVYTNQNIFNDENRNNTLFNSLVDGSFNDFTTNDVSRYNADYSLNFKQEFDSDKHFLEFDGFFSNGDNEEDADFFWESAGAPYTQQNNEDRDQTRLKLDYTRPSGEKGKWETGLFYENQGIANEFYTNQVDGAFIFPDINFDYDRDIVAAYINYGHQWEKWGVQLGLRAEQVTEDANTRQFNGSENGDFVYENQYEELYPSAFFTYQLNEKDQFSFSYSRRVDRPGINQVTPVREWQTALVRSIGNPDLKPQFTNSFEIGYLRQMGSKGSLNANVFYRKITDNISRYITQDPQDETISLLQFTNVNDSDSYGFEISGFYKVNKWWSFNASFDIFNNTLIGPDGTNPNQTIEVENTMWNARMSQDFSLTKTLKFQWFNMYRGAFQFLQGEMQPMYRMDIGLRKTFADGKGTLSMRYSDIFNTFFAEAILDNPQDQRGEFNWESQSFYVGLNWTFGGKVRSRKDKQQNQSESGGGGIGF